MEIPNTLATLNIPSCELATINDAAKINAAPAQITVVEVHSALNSLISMLISLYNILIGLVAVVLYSAVNKIEPIVLTLLG
jgi:hypothetical protein